VSFVVAVGALCGLPLLYLGLVVAWEDRSTRGLSYYARSADGRRRYRRILAVHRSLLAPVLWLLGRRVRFNFRSGSAFHGGLAAPKGSRNPASLEFASRYRPSPDDVFVVTQMRCGTTWMQQIVYEILTRGSNDLDTAGRTLCEISPRLESFHGVPVAAAPRIGLPPSRRVIKTHLSAAVCPYSDRARYIYVTRHPASCFASCVSFLNLNLRGFAPRLEDIEAWFCSPQAMWWGTWPAHVRGWWERSWRCANVLFVFYEEMKRDLPAEVQRIAGFLGVPPLSPQELERVLLHSSYSWMQSHAEAFEIHPPHLLLSEPTFFVSGRMDRYEDVPDELRRRIVSWCQTELADSSFPWERFFPESAPFTAPAITDVGQTELAFEGTSSSRTASQYQG